MDALERRVRRRMRDDFPHYARKLLRIRTKAGAIDPFVINRAQQYLHDRAEAQRKRIGKVRLIVVKGRQQGISTYWQGRTYWRVTHSHGVQAYILTHEQAATDNLFAMTSRFHDHLSPLFRPVTGASNAKELAFSRLDSGYSVATAGSKGVGRSKTIQMFHGSEVAYWPNARDHLAGVMQAIPDEPGTEVLLESTGNGPGDVFHSMWQMAMSGGSDYEAVFIPWFWQPEYQSPADSLLMDESDEEYQRAWSLTNEQMAWRARKIVELGGDQDLFRKEYPANPQEAFAASADESFIKPETVQIARRAVADPSGPRLLGVDPARFGKDLTALCERQGRVVKAPELFAKRDTMEVAGLVKQRLDAGIDIAFVDVIGVGAGVVDRLREMGYGDRIIAVNAGDSALDDAKYSNKRAEMYGVLREWLKEQPACLPDDDALQADLCSARYTYTSKSQYKLESKDDLKKRLGRSPDRSDALALTFAQPVVPRHVNLSAFVRPQTRRQGSWMS